MQIAQKYSRKRQAILEVIRSTDVHPTAEWIYSTLKPEIPDLSLGTVYRNITLFKRSGDVASVTVVGGQERLDGTVEPHPHFICDDCGRVYDVDDMRLNCDLDKQIEAGYGHQVRSHDLLFHGRCRDCL